MSGGRDPRKGFDLLQAALQHLRDESSVRGLELVVFGQHAPQSPPSLGFSIHYTGGLPDIVEHQRTGYLAKAFETEDLAQGIAWVLAQRDSGQLGQQARERAVARFSEGVVAEGYGVVYEESR